MVTRTRLPLRFDPQPLRSEADALPADAWVPHFNTQYYEGEWSGVALRSVGGRDQQLYPDTTAAEPYAPTPTLARCPELARVLSRLECELLSARLLRLGPGAAIREHSDLRLGYDDGEIRIHVPLSTNPDVAFIHDGTRVDMAAGEAWYMDLNLRHAVRNESAEPRVHLVIDCVVNDWLRDLLQADADADADAETETEVAVAVDHAPLGIAALERLRRSIAEPTPRTPEEFAISHAVLDRIGIGLEPAHQFVFGHRPSSAEFERWLLVQLGGHIGADVVADANALAAGEMSPGRRAEQALIDGTDPPLSAQDLDFWERNGYVILRAAAPGAACAKLRDAVYEYVEAEPDDPDTWYRDRRQQGVMVQLFNAPGMAEIHASLRIRKAFAQLAGTSDLIMSSDRCGFNPPVRPENPYSGARLHLDLPSFETPIATHLQGIVYLTDTVESQGALCLVPGFHRQIDGWVRSLPAGTDPTLADFEAFGPVPIAAGAGDLIIWDARLPHGPSPNTATQPRVVHYLRMYPRPSPAGDSTLRS